MIGRSVAEFVMRPTKDPRSAKAAVIPTSGAPALGAGSPLRADSSIKGRDLMLCGLLIAATLAVYAQVRGFDFVIIDDALYVGDNEHVRNGVSLENLRWAFTTFRDGNWFPLTWISLMIDASAYGTWAGGYHL